MKAIRALLAAAAAPAALAIPPAAPAFAAASQAGCTEITVHTTTTGGDTLVVDNNGNPRLGDWTEVTVGSTHYWTIKVNENWLPVTLRLSSTYSPPSPYGVRRGTPVTFPAGPVTFTTVCN